MARNERVFRFGAEPVRTAVPSRSGGASPSRVVGIDGGPGRPTAPGEPDPVRLRRGFLRRVVDYLTVDRGVRQFVDWGAALPGIAEAVRRHAPGARTVHVAPEGADTVFRGCCSASVLCGRGHAPAETVALMRNRGLVDFGAPVAVLATAPLTAEGAPRLCQAAAAVHAAVRAEGYLALSAPAGHRDELTAAFGPFTLLDPGLSDLAWWPYPDEAVPAPGSGALGGLGRYGPA